MKEISKKEYNQLHQDVEKAVETAKVNEKKTRLGRLETKSLEPNFWQDQVSSQQMMGEIGDLQGIIKETEKLITSSKTLRELCTIATEQDQNDLTKEYHLLQTRLKTFTRKIYLSGIYDKNNAILSIHAGQGGTDAQDWAQMLLDMYSRYFERKGWKYSIDHLATGDEAGIHTAIIHIEGEYVYGLLKMETGIHRLVRLSPFNAQNLRQTSFAAIDVLPVLKDTDETDIQLLDNDIEFKAMRSGGPGGQSVNKTSSAVQLTHTPSGIVVRCSEQRSQSQNRQHAKEILRAKLWKKKIQENKKQIKDIKGEQKVASWGNQVRNYVLHPYKLVKDLRTGVESSNPESVLNGKLDQFIDAGIRMSYDNK